MNRPRIQGVNGNIPTIFQLAPCVKFVLFWKYHENRFNRFSSMLLRVIDSSEKIGTKNPVFKGLNGISWNVQIFPCMKSHLPWKCHENPFSRFSEMLLTDRQTNRQTRRPVMMPDDAIVDNCVGHYQKYRICNCTVHWQYCSFEQQIIELKRLTKTSRIYGTVKASICAIKPLIKIVIHQVNPLPYVCDSCDSPVTCDVLRHGSISVNCSCFQLA